MRAIEFPDPPLSDEVVLLRPWAAMRCGFTREGLLRSHMRSKGGRRDTVVFGLLAEDERPGHAS